jgi:hypothetical protein
MKRKPNDRRRLRIWRLTPLIRLTRLVAKWRVLSQQPTDSCWGAGPIRERLRMGGCRPSGPTAKSFRQVSARIAVLDWPEREQLVEKRTAG